MKLYRYMSFEFLRDTILDTGFAAQYASRFDDAFEGVAGIRINGIQVPMQLAPSAFNQSYSILCFNKAEETAPHHEMLMWSLYANKNRGVRVVLDLPWSNCLAMRYAVMDNVRYDANIPLIDVVPKSIDEILQHCSCINAMECIEWIESMYFVKHPCWEWEKEYRVVVVNSEIPDVVSKTKHCQSREARYCATFLKQYIVGVDFGLNLWRDQRVEVQKVMDEIRTVRDDLTFRMPVCFSNQKSYTFDVIG